MTMACDDACVATRRTVCCFWVVDDNSGYRKLQPQLLEQQDWLQCTGSYPSAEAALAALAQVPAPNLILMDLKIPGINGVEAIDPMRALAPNARILIVSTFDSPSARQEALMAGASGFLRKAESCGRFFKVIQEALARPVPGPVVLSVGGIADRTSRLGWLRGWHQRLRSVIGI